MNILVTGAAGFIGSGIVERLLAGGHNVIACVRDGRNLPGSDLLRVQYIDLNDMQSVEGWLPLLDGVDAVVNAAGILRERRPGDFKRIHYQAPLALAKASAKKGIRCFLQLSALGHSDDGEFVASKHRFDRALLEIDDLSAVVLRPSVVVSLRGSYGGTSMLRAMAALPLVMLLPGNGSQKIQPIWLEDLAAMVEQSLAQPPGPSMQIDAVGPDVISLRDFLLATRRWLKLPEPRMFIAVPMRLVSSANTVGDWLHAGPLGRTMGRMLERGSISEGANDIAADHLGIRARSVIAGFDQSASFVQDRWQARLYPLVPLAWLALVVIWLFSALSGFLAAPADYAPLLDRIGVPSHQQEALVLASSSLNLLLALALAMRRWLSRVLGLMLLSVLAYTLALGTLAPEQWLDLTGGLLKNLGLIILIGFVMVLENRR